MGRYGPSIALAAASGVAFAVLGVAGVPPFARVAHNGPVGLVVLVVGPVVATLLLSLAWISTRRTAAPVSSDERGTSHRVPDESTATHPHPAPVVVDEAAMKVCPRCAGPIRAAATACRFCGLELTAPVRAAPTNARIGVVVALTIVVVGIGAVAWSSAAFQGRHTVRGVVLGASGDQWQRLDWLQALSYATPHADGVVRYPACTTQSPYSDIHTGTTVTLRDGAGTLTGVGSLGGGTLTFADDAWCEFSFELEGVTDAAYYSVAVGNRGPLDLVGSELQADGWSVSIRIGG